MSKSKKMPRLIAAVRRDISLHPQYPDILKSSDLDFLFKQDSLPMLLRMKLRHFLEPRQQNQLLRNVWKALYHGVKAKQLAILVKPAPDSATWKAMSYKQQSDWCDRRTVAFRALMTKSKKQ